MKEPNRQENPEREGWTQEEMIAWIGQQDFQGLLSWWRFAPPGDPFFQGKTGDHYSRVMAERKAELEKDEPAAASKRVGWSSPSPGSIPRREE